MGSRWKRPSKWFEGVPNILSIMFHFMALQDNEIEPMGERTRTDLQRGMAYVEGRPVAGACRTASYRHHHRKGNQDSSSCRRTIRASFLVGPKKGLGSTIRPPRPEPTSDTACTMV